MNNDSQRADLGFIAIVALVILVIVWLLLTPIVPSVSMSTMRRFQLASSSFTKWAIQFPIPAMYNFANRYEARYVPPGLVDPIVPPKYSGHLNHFPARTLTFADGRFKHLREGKDCWVEWNSSYRGRSLTTTLHAQRVGQKFELRRLTVQESQP